MTEYAFVLDANGNKLSPTKTSKSWFLIRKQRAQLVSKFPMVIQLFKTIDQDEIDQTPIVLGIDDGSKCTGIAFVQACQTKNKPVWKGTIEHRQDVKHKMDVRRGYRKYKRSHKRYRKPRFDNRSSSNRKSRIAPSIKQKREATVRVVNTMNKWCRIDRIYLEDVAIDIRALQEGYKLYRWQYQKSNRLDENLRKATILRDYLTCQDCGKTNCKLEAHHIIPRRIGGNNAIDNLISLCHSCHEKIDGKEMTNVARYQTIINGKNVNFIHAQHVMQGKKFLQQELKGLAPLVRTTGGDTANKRIDWDIEKSHSNDAIVISNLEVSPMSCAIKDYKIKPMRRKTKSIIKEFNGFKHRDLVCYTKKNRESYVGYITVLNTKRKTFDMKTLNGNTLKKYGVKSVKLLWRFNKIYWF